MRILVDADSCPRQIRDIIRRAAGRTKCDTLFVADRDLKECRGTYVSMLVVPVGADRADDSIAQEVSPGDLVITHDIILASRVVALGAVAIDDRGGIYTEENIAERLSIRNMMSEFRQAGLQTEKQSPIGAREVQRFASALDSTLTRLLVQER